MRVDTDTGLLQPGADFIALELGRDGGSRCGWLVGSDVGPATAGGADVSDAFLEFADEGAGGGLGALFLERWGGRAGALVEELGVETHDERLGRYFGMSMVGN